jgi:hypothetical protein
MKKIYFEKIGRRYQPVYEYDSNLIDAMPKGNHLVMCYPGGHSTHYNIEPALAPLIAAGRVAETAMRDAICRASEMRASEMRPTSTPLTAEQKAAWEHLIAAFGDDARMLQWPATRDIAEAGIQALQEEADRLMKHESVRHAYEQFLLVCQLTKESRSA